jgi:hypothetical protein
MSEQEKLISGLSPLSDAEIEEGPGNLERSLDASDQKREAGVQEAVDPVYPPTGLGLAGVYKIAYNSCERHPRLLVEDWRQVYQK